MNDPVISNLDVNLQELLPDELIVNKTYYIATSDINECQEI